MACIHSKFLSTLLLLITIHPSYSPSPSTPVMRLLLPLATSWLAICALFVPAHASPLVAESSRLDTRATNAYVDPNTVGGGMLTIIPDMDVGEPINLIVSALSDESVLTIEGFLLWVTSINFGVSCYGQGSGGAQSANLGDGNQTQGTENGDNGVLRWNYFQPYVGTCIETFLGGNHFRWFKQKSSGAIFLAASRELDLANHHMIDTNGYNLGRDEVVGNATFTNGTAWEGNLYNTTVEWIEAGVLLNATSEGVNHPEVALPGQPSQDGRIALLTVRQLKNANAAAAQSSASPSSLPPSFDLSSLFVGFASVLLSVILVLH